MANEATPVFNAEQTPVLGRLSVVLTILGPLLILLGAVRVAVGALEMWKSSFWYVLVFLPQGLLLVFAGLAFWAGASDAKFLHDVKGREKEHFTHTLQSVNVGFVALLILGGYVATLAFFNLFM